MNIKPERSRLLLRLILTGAFLMMSRHQSAADFDLTGRWVLFYVGYNAEVDEIEITQSGTTLMYGDRVGTIDPVTGRFVVIIAKDERCPEPPYQVNGTVIDADHFETYVAGYAPWIFGGCRFMHGLDANGIRAEIAPPTRTPLPTSTLRPTRTPAPSQTPSPTRKTTETPAPTEPPFNGPDMSGQWHILFTYGGEEIVEITQKRSRLTFSDPYDDHPGRIDEGGGFVIALREVPECPGENTLSGSLTADANYFDGRISIHVRTADTCFYRHAWTVYGARVGAPPRPTATLRQSPSPTPTPAPIPCVGDCNRDGQVTIHELMKLVHCHSPLLPIIGPPCGVDCADANASDAIEVNELVMAVNNALRGCQ